MPLLAHALPQSVGAVPLTLLLTLVAGLLLGVNAMATRRSTARLSERVAPGAGTTGRAAVGAAGGAEDDPRPRAGQLVGLVLLVVLAVLATSGPTDPAENLSDALVLTHLWGVVAITSAVLGHWWWRVDPLRAAGGLLSRAVGDPEQELAHPLPGGLATAGAIGGVLAWAGVQLFANPGILTFQLLLIGYVAVHLAGSARYGLAWIQQVEPLEVVSTLLGLVRLTGGGPLQRLTRAADGTRLRGVCAVLIAWSLTDLLVETEAWHELGLSSATATWVGVGVLLGGTAALHVLIDASSGRARSGPAFVAVAAAWVLAHHLSLLMVEGQGLAIWLSDPLASGADLFGLRGARVDPEPLPVEVMAALQVIPFVLGHLAATAVVQRRAVAAVRTPGQLGVVTLPARTLIGVLLIGGMYLQLGGV